MLIETTVAFAVTLALQCIHMIGDQQSFVFLASLRRYIQLASDWLHIERSGVNKVKVEFI